MAAGDVNVQTKTISAGAITLSGSPTGSGLYRIATEAAAATDDLTSIAGGSGYAVITLTPATDGQFFALRHDGATIVLAEELDFVSGHLRDRITLRDDEGDGSVWVEESRRQFPPAS